MRIGVRLGIYAGGGSLAGVVGFGTLWRGAAAGHPSQVLEGLALVVVGLVFAGVALAAGMMAGRRRRETGTRSGPVQP